MATATQTQQKASSLVKELVERYDRLDRELREVRARGEALEVELKGLQERRARLAERLKWGEERSTAALDQQIRDLKAIIADTRAEFEGLR
ncbi:MAG TPA: hypothetical protein EYP19_13885, partial [Desulfobacterales bacterium]|nr:hypothetical protein [Desulfobacterales bacterium]